MDDIASTRSPSALLRHRVVQHAFSLAAAVIAAVVTVIATRRGIGLSWDSTDYIAVGQTIARYGFALDVTALPMTIRPPGLSIAVTIGEYVGVSPSVSLRLLNAVSIALSMVARDAGLKIKSTAPAFIASTASGAVDSPLIKMTGVVIDCSQTRLRRSRPDSNGILMSTKITEGTRGT